MVIADFHHGVRVTELTEGSNSIRVVSTAIIGMVATASDADAAAFPIDKPVLFTSLAKALRAMADKGSAYALLNGTGENFGAWVPLLQFGVDVAA